MNDERRRYFRIDETMGVSYRLLSEAEAKAFAKQRNKGEVDYSANFDNRIQTLLDACRIQAPIAAELIDLVNKKLNFVIHQMDIDTHLMQQVAFSLQKVNVSACGMAFHCEENLALGKKLQIELLLHPGELRVTSLAQVVASSAALDGGEQDYFIRVEFQQMTNHDQELLIQHIVKGQSVQLKKQRLLSEQEDIG